MQYRLPCRREHPSLARTGTGGRLKGSMGAAGADNPFPSVHGRVCYTRASRTVTAGNSTERYASTAVERFLATRLCGRAGGGFDRGTHQGSVSLIWGQGPAGLSAGYTAALGMRSNSRRGPLRRDLHFGIPAYRLPRPTLIARSAGLKISASRFSQSQVEDVLQEQAAGGFDPVFICDRRASGESMWKPGPRRRQSVDAVSLLRIRDRPPHPVLAAESSSMAAATRRSTPPEP